MKTNIECIPCLLKQAVGVIDTAGSKPAIQEKIIRRIAKKIAAFDINEPPPVIAKAFYNIVSAESGIKDPYKKIKLRSNKLALKLYPILEKKISNSRNPLRAALEIAGAGNVIDFGVLAQEKIWAQINSLLKGEDFFNCKSAIKKALISEFSNKLKKKQKRFIFSG